MIFVRVREPVVPVVQVSLPTCAERTVGILRLVRSWARACLTLFRKRICMGVRSSQHSTDVLKSEQGLLNPTQQAFAKKAEVGV